MPPGWGTGVRRTLVVMARFLVVLAVVAVAFTVYTLVDVLMTDRSRVRGLTKPIWAILVVLLPVVGGLLWLLIGKARRTSGGSRVIAPDDDPDFLGSINREDAARRAEHEERLRRLEQELADLDDDTRDDSAR
jgi:hypothetical protein